MLILNGQWRTGELDQDGGTVLTANELRHPNMRNDENALVLQFMVIGLFHTHL
jgi:hypothetical protein